MDWSISETLYGGVLRLDGEPGFGTLEAGASVNVTARFLCSTNESFSSSLEINGATGVPGELFEIVVPVTGEIDARPGTLTVTTSTSGENLPDQYRVFDVLSDADLGTIGLNETKAFPNAPAGSYPVQLVPVSSGEANCTSSEGMIRDVTVPAGGAAALSFAVTCTSVSPAVTITSPEDGASFTEDAEISFIGSAVDAVDGVITDDASLSWTSSIDGEICVGTGCLIQLSPGEHLITFTAPTRTETRARTRSPSRSRPASGWCSAPCPAVASSDSAPAPASTRSPSRVGTPRGGTCRRTRSSPSAPSAVPWSTSFPTSTPIRSWATSSCTRTARGGPSSCPTTRPGSSGKVQAKRPGGVSGIGQAKSVQRDPETGEATIQTYTNTENLDAISVDEDFAVAWRVDGDGISAFNPSRPVLFALVPTLTLLALTGDDVGEIVDEWQRLMRELDCGAVARALATPALLACVFTAGQFDPAFRVIGQEEADGHGTAVLVDTEAQTVESLEWIGAPVVGASYFEYGSRSFLGWTRQLDSTVEIREVDENGYTGWSRSVDLSAWCRRPMDFAVTPSGEYGAVTCLGEEEVSPMQYVGFRMPLF